MPTAKTQALSADTLWQLERLGPPSVAPDGAHAVVSLSTPSMDDNQTRSALWLLSTLGGQPRALTSCGNKDSMPAWSPTGERIAFTAKREQQGVKDEETQLYLIAPDGGEAQRAGPVATGVDSFRWFPDGRRVAFVSWVWPELKGAKAQAKRRDDVKARKETGYATSEVQYRHWDHNLPEGRVTHLHVLDLASGRTRDLFEGKPFELSRTDPSAQCFDVSPDGRRIVFAFDPEPVKRIENCFALAEIELGSGRVTEIVRDKDWQCSAPRYSPDGQRIAFLASHYGLKHTMPDQLATWERKSGQWQVESAQWDHEVQAPLLWEDDGSALIFPAEQKGRRHLWRFDLADRRAQVVVTGGWVQGFDKAAGVLVTVADAMLHPARAHAHLPGKAPRRIESFNNALLAKLDLGRSEEIWIKGAQEDPVQVWMVYPPGFSAKKTYPLLHVIHGGPHAAAGDTFHYRWNYAMHAAQGYVVAAVNYHGSTSFGYAFTDSITHRWGALELQDIEAATDHLLRQPWADKRRVFASGGSYGGYMVAWMNAHVPVGRYQAYVCHAGCFDWTAMYADDASAWHSRELGANYWDDMARINAQSPHAFAAQMDTPTLVIHGALDYRVPDQQGLAYYNTLQARGVPARLLWFPDENHWILKPRNAKLWWTEFFAWLCAHDKAAKPRRKTRA